MTASTSTPRPLEWDSAFFGLRIGSVSPAPQGRADLAAAIAAAREQSFDCVYVLCDVQDQGGIQALCSVGARLVDVRMTFDRGLATLAPVAAHPAIRAARAEDVPALRALASKSHDSSRFYADGRFPRERCDELFATWIEKSCGGWAEVVRVAEIEGRVCGYTTGHVREDGRGEIGLVAVDPAAQGHGLGTKLVASTLQALRDRGLLTATVVTQARNIGAQRLYQTLGFRTQRVQTWHHLWLDEVRP